MAPDLSQLKVLIVDDMGFWRSLMRTYVESVGVRRIETTGSVPEAWNLAQKLRPDMLVCDWQMLDGEGIDLLRMIRHSDRSPNRFMKVMMVTAFSEEYRVRRALREGISAYIAKPMTPGAFLEKFMYCAQDNRHFAESGSYFGPSRGDNLGEELEFV